MRPAHARVLDRVLTSPRIRRLMQRHVFSRGYLIHADGQVRSLRDDEAP